MNLNLVIILFCCGLLILLVVIFNKLTTRKNQIQNAISSLDALFIKRQDLIPNLISVVKKYMEFEKDTLEKITQLRTLKNENNYINDNESTTMMKQLMVQVENYPELKADNQFTNLQYSFNECEEQIAAGRRFLSSSITGYNNQVSVFPANIIAKAFGFKTHQWEFATSNQRQNIDANQLLN
jgi:LemA protein